MLSMKNALTVAAGLAALSVSSASYASQGTITFNGQVNATSCKVDVESSNGTVENSNTVTLPTVWTSNLAADGATAGQTPYAIVLSNCSPANGTVSVYYEGSNIVTSGDGLGTLKNNGTATNVNLQLRNRGGATALDLSTPSGGQGVAPATITMGSGRLPFDVWYVAVGGGATAGTVTSTVDYSMIYP